MRGQIWGGRAPAAVEAVARGVRVQGEVGRRRDHEGSLRVAGCARPPPPCTASGRQGRDMANPQAAHEAGGEPREGGGGSSGAVAHEASVELQVGSKLRASGGKSGGRRGSHGVGIEFLELTIVDMLRSRFTLSWRHPCRLIWWR
jgi:hypothetical protein